MISRLVLSSVLSYNLGLIHADTTIVITLTSLFAIVIIIWGLLFLSRKMKWNQIKQFPKLKPKQIKKINCSIMLKSVIQSQRLIF